MTVTTAPTARGAPISDSATRPEAHGAMTAPASDRLAITLQIVAALLWIPQAGLLAFAVGNIAAGAPAVAALWPAAGIFTLGVARATMERVGTLRAFATARTRLSELRRQAIEAAAARAPLDAQRPSSGLVASIVTEQAEAVLPYLARFQPLRMKVVVVPLVIVGFVFSLSWVAGLVLVLAAPVIPVFMALIGWHAKEASERQLVRMGDMNAFLLDRLRGLATIRAFDAVERTARRLRSDAEDLRVSTMGVLRIAFLSSAVLELFAALGVALVAVYVGFHFLGEITFGAWGRTLTLGEGLFILLLAPAFFEPLRDLSSVWHDRASGVAGIEAMEKLATPAPAILGDLDHHGSASAQPALSVDVDALGIRHSGNAETTVDRLYLSVKAGERVAIMAPSGGGKSTLLAALAGLIEPHAGAIRLGGEPLTRTTAARLRTSIAWLGQPPHIFTGTLRGNIALGRSEVTPQDIERALNVARIDHLAARRGAAPIGENGAGISGGEALRLALARTAAGIRPGLILADEPTAHLDDETARDITESLLALATGTTLIVATHDPVLAARMDRIIRISDGDMCEDSA